MNSGRIWPYAIAASIILVFGFCVATVVITQQRPVEESDTYMMSYHEGDTKANELIQARIDFNKKYKLEYVTDGLHINGSVVKYRVVDLNSKPVNNAKIKVIITRPNNHKYDKELVNPSVKDGVYSFASVKLPKEGRWDVMAKISVGDLQRFYHVKADTRSKEAFEY